jgi:hypothetical protein
VTDPDPVVQSRRRTDQNRRYNIAMVAMVFVACVLIVGTVIIGTVKIDEKASTTQAVAVSTHKDVVAIRSAQKANTKTNDCVAQTTNNAVQDVILALVDHDQDKSDYKALAKCKT